MNIPYRLSLVCFLAILSFTCRILKIIDDAVLTQNFITRSYCTFLSIHQLVGSFVTSLYLILFLSHLSLLLFISPLLTLSLSVSLSICLSLITLHQVLLWPLQLLCTNSRNRQVTTCPHYFTRLNSTSFYFTLLISGHVLLDYFVSCLALFSVLSYSFIKIDLHRVSPVHKI